VAVEKLAHSEFAKIGSRQEALQTIFSVSQTFSSTRFPTFFRKTEFFNSHPVRNIHREEERFQWLQPLLSMTPPRSAPTAADEN
jgi:hypothetical protein